MLRSQPVVNPDASVEETRAGFEQMASMFPVDADIKREVVSAAGVKAEWVSAPDADAGRAVLYLHGGGYVIGSIDTHRSLAARLSRASKAPVLVIDYRLAPEHPHPAAVDDAVTTASCSPRALKPARIAVAGDSAGGGLTVATLVAIRDAKLPASGGGRVPLAVGRPRRNRRVDDDKGGRRSHRVQKAGIQQMAAAYLGGKDPRTPLAAPLYADLSGLPPLLIQVGTAETLLDDASRLAERARKAGVTVSYESWESMIHVWHLFAPMLDEGQQAIDRIGEFVRKQAP